jgi:hypothetical protein
MSATVTVSFSEIDTFRQCGFKHKLAYRDRWSKPPKEGGALARGSLFHRMLEDRYRHIMEWQRTDARFSDVDPDYLLGRGQAVLLEAQHEGTDADTLDLLDWVYRGYCEQWAEEMHHQRTLAVEHVALIPLRNPQGRPTRYRVKVIIDHIKEQNGRLWVEDHKSHAYIPHDKDLDFHDQFSLYIMGLRRLGKPVFGGIYNAARTNRPKIKELSLDDRFVRMFLSRTEAELRAVERDTLATVQLMYSKRNPAVRAPNPDTCKWRCDFTEACLYGRKTDDDGRTLHMLERQGFVQDQLRH